MRSYLCQRVTDCSFQRTRAAATEPFVQSFKTLDEICNMLAWIHAPGFGTKVGAAAERSVFVNGAAAITPQKRAGSVRMRLEHLATAGADSLGGI